MLSKENNPSGSASDIEATTPITTGCSLKPCRYCGGNPCCHATESARLAAEQDSSEWMAQAKAYMEQCADQMQRVAAAEAEVARLRAEVETLKAERVRAEVAWLSEAIKEESDSRGEVTKLRAELAEVKRHFAEDTRDIETVEAERDAARAQVETLRAALTPFVAVGGTGILHRHLIEARAALAQSAPSTVAKVIVWPASDTKEQK